MRILRRFLSHWQNWLGVLLVAFFVFVAVAAPVISPDDPKQPGPIKVVGKVTDQTPTSPFGVAPLGTLPGQGQHLPYAGLGNPLCSDFRPVGSYLHGHIRDSGRDNQRVFRRILR